MKLSRPNAEIFVPDGLAPEAALSRTTHLAVAAHPDDLEIMAFDGIKQCFQRPGRWFCGVVATDGAGSPRDDLYKDYTDEAMKQVRRKEQKKAAVVGELGALALLDHPSVAAKDPKNRGLVDDLLALLQHAKPQVVYTHNLADKHDTHAAVASRVIAALRELPQTSRPHKVYGCEVWRDLDWMVDSDKVAFDVSGHESLQAALLGVFDSQICGGKRYDLATLGRRRAHATYHDSHATDLATGITFAMDVTPLVLDASRDLAEFVQEHLDRLARDVKDRLQRVGLSP